jgi:hypothetical protein
MNTKYKMMFFQDDAGGPAGGGGDGGGGESLGGAAFTPPGKMSTGEKPLPIDKVIEQHDPQVPAQDGPKPEFDPSKFAKEFGETVAESLKTTVKPAEPPMTKEQAVKLLNVWSPDDVWYASYDNLDTRKSAIEQMRDGLIRQADTLAQLRMQEELTKLREEYAPKLSMVEEHANRQREERFHGEFPQLKNPGLQPLISAVTEDLVKQGKTFTTEGEMFKAVANGVAAVIKVTNPEFTLETAGSTPANTGRTGNQIPVTTPGAGGGTGRTTGAVKGPVKKGLSIFD